MTTVCRVCLSDDDILNILENDLLTDVYDKLSNFRFNSEDGRPRVLCCVCHEKLKTCQNFYEMTLRSEKVLSQLLSKGLEATRKHITELNNVVEQLSTANKQSVIDNANESTEVIVKVEPISETEAQLLEIEYVSKESTQFQDQPIILNTEDQLAQPEDPSISSADCGNSQIISVKSVKVRHGTNKEKPFSCSVCNKRFTQKYHVVRHMLIHTGEKPYSCDICDKKFNKKNILLDHIKIHTGIKPFGCEICNKQFNCKSNLVGHMRTHTGVKPFSCSVCHEQFINKVNLAYHMHTHAVSKQKRSDLFVCDVCKNKYNRKCSLVNHMRIHTRITSLACHICGKKLKSKRTLVVHMRIHTEKKPIACNVCEKQITPKNVLNFHNKQKHYGKKSYECSVCDKIFNLKSQLFDHMKSHPGKKLFACSVCHKEFNYKSNLVDHMRIHTGERPFACDLCNKQFNQKNHLVYHKYSLHAK